MNYGLLLNDYHAVADHQILRCSVCALHCATLKGEILFGFCLSATIHINSTREFLLMLTSKSWEHSLSSTYPYYALSTLSFTQI